VTRSEPLVSVVLPTHRRAGRFLEEAIASALAQTLRELEVIVVDDGVPDGLSGLDRLDQRITVVRSLGHGAAMARNTGNALARGRYVAVLDHDDRWLPRKLEQQVQRMEADDGAAMCHCQFEVIDAAGAVTGPGWAGPVGRDALATGLLPMAHPTTLWRRDVLELVGGYDPNLWPADDLDLVAKVASRWPVVFEPATLAQYRWHGENISMQLAPQFEAARRALAFRVSAAVARGDVAPPWPDRAPTAIRVLRRSYVRTARDRALLALQAGQVGEALRMGMWAAKVDPVGAVAAFGGRGVGWVARRTRSLSDPWLRELPAAPPRAPAAR